MAEMFLTFCLKLGVQLGMSFSVMEKKQNFIYKTITIMSSLHWDENDDTFVFFRQMMNCNVLLSLVRTKERLIIYVVQ